MTETRQVKGQDTVFALGDITDVAEPKQATAANRHVEVVAGDIKALVEGKRELAAYQPRPAAIILPLGPAGGAAQLLGRGNAGPDVTSQFKGADLLTGRLGQLLCASTAPSNSSNAKDTSGRRRKPAPV
ncbi:hypothetical protein ABZY09_24960 [Streptomyces sp. NPDC002928]|uniref:hypothetical protein n=1 Tax=Streptomyces sp. NPDC002928 TaxID=3154440 RepID=UPI0033A3C3E5